MTELITLRGIRLRILASKDIYKKIGLAGVGKQKGRFEIHLADTSQQQNQQEHQRLQTKVSFLVVDSKVSLVEEEPKAYNKDNNHNEKISLATFSNSESTVLAYISIFETLWT
jgi:hypothetical protein